MAAYIKQSNMDKTKVSSCLETDLMAAYIDQSNMDTRYTRLSKLTGYNYVSG